LVAPRPAGRSRRSFAASGRRTTIDRPWRRGLLLEPAQSFIGTRLVEGYRLVQIDDVSVIESYQRLADVVSARCGRSVAALFAEPRITRGNGAAPARIDWYARFEGIARPLNQLDASSAATVRRTLASRLAALRPLAFDPECGPLVAAALNIAAPESILSVGGDPVLADWGILPLALPPDERSRSRHFAATLGPLLPDFPVPPLSRADWGARFAGANASARRPAAPAAAPPAPPAGENTAARPPGPKPLRGLRVPLIAAGIAALVFGLAMTPGVLVFPADRSHTPESERMLAIAKNVAGQLEVRRRQLEEALAEDCTALIKRLTTGALLPPQPADVQVQLPPVPGAPNSSSQTVGLPARVDPGTVLVVASKTIGSGFFTADDTIVTGRDVVGADDTVWVANKAIGALEAKVIARGGAAPDGSAGYDDFAVLRVPAQTGAKPFHLASPPQRLQPVIAVGFPRATMADGVLDRLRGGDRSASSALSPEISAGEVNDIQPQAQAGVTLIVHGADTSSGYQGGPLIDLCGRVVGINMFTPSDKAIAWRYALGSDGLLGVLQKAGSHPQLEAASCTPRIAGATSPQAEAAKTASPPAEAVKAPAPSTLPAK